MKRTNTINTVTAAMAIAVVGLLSAGCVMDELQGLFRISSDGIGFTFSDNTATTKAGEAVAMGTTLALVSEDGRDTLLVSRSICRTADDALYNEGVRTKGAPVTTGTLSDKYPDAVYMAAYDDTKEYIPAQVLTYKEKDGASYVWRTKVNDYLWPDDSGKPLTFWAWAPNGTAAGTLTPSINASAGTLTFNYVTPVSAGAGTDAEAQKDILLAHTKTSRSECADNKNRAPLAFDHALSAIRFQVDRAYKCTIKSVSLSNVYSKGTCSFNGSNITWSNYSEPKTFTETFNTAIDEYLNDDFKNPQALDKSSNGAKTFLLIPQSATSTKKVKITVVARLNGASSDITLEAELAPSEAVWKPGYTYTYSLSNVGNGLEIEVTDNVSGGKKSNLVIKSTNKSMVKCYIRATIVGNWYSAANTISSTWALTDGTFSPALPTGSTAVNNWMLGSDGYYYYKYPVHPGKETGIKVDGSGTADKLFTTYTAPTGKSGTLNIDILAQGVQWDVSKSLVNKAWGSSAGSAVINFLSATDKP